MNPPRCGEENYIDFLIASPKSVPAVEAARVQPEGFRAASHDAFTRLLHRLEPDPDALWAEVPPRPARRLIVIDGSTLDEPHARHIDLVTPPRSGRHKAVVRGINLFTLLATDGDARVPCDDRVYRKDDLTKNEHFRAMLTAARDRGIRPEGVAFDGWYASVGNLKRVRSFG
jgi:putative transposase